MEFDYEKDLSINKYRLDEECLTHSSTYFRYMEASVQAKSRISKLQNKLAMIEAEENLAIRKSYQESGAKFTEAVIASELTTNSRVIECKRRLQEAQEVYSTMQVAVSAMEARKSELDNLVKLYVAGYFSTTDGAKAKTSADEQVSKDIRKNLNKGKKDD